MALQAVELWPETVLTTGATILYTSPLGTPGALIKSAVALNSTGAALTVTIYKVPSGGTAAAGNEVYQALSIPAGNGVPLDLLTNMVLPPGATIQALASATGVNTTGSGFTL